MPTPAYFFALSEDGIANLSHGLASIRSARSRPPSRHRWSVARLAALLATGLGVAASMLLTGCGRSPSGVLQETVPSTSPPPTPAFASNSLRTAEAIAEGTAEGAPKSPLTNEQAAAPQAPRTTGEGDIPAAAGQKADEVCSVAGLLHAKALTDEHYEVRRRDVDSVISALQERARNPKDENLVAIRTENGLPGLQVRGVGTNAKCGLRANDILVSLNEVSVTDRAKLAENRERFRTADEFRLLIERDRKAIQLTYDVRE